MSASRTPSAAMRRAIWFSFSRLTGKALIECVLESCGRRGISATPRRHRCPHCGAAPSARRPRKDRAARFYPESVQCRETFYRGCLAAFGAAQKDGSNITPSGLTGKPASPIEIKNRQLALPVLKSARTSSLGRHQLTTDNGQSSQAEDHQKCR